MISVAICDDRPDQLACTGDLVVEFIKTQATDAQVRCFAHPDQLLDALAGQAFQVYLLDIVMPMLGGIELGREIRKLDREAQIIYVTTEPQFALESFGANPLDYLLKPVSRERLFTALALAFSRVSGLYGKTHVVRTADGLRTLSLSEIVCCEYRRHAVTYMTARGEKIASVTLRQPFSDIVAPLLRDGRFIQPHAAFVANLSRVERLTRDAFHMQGGAVVPIVQKRHAQASDRYMDYLLNQGGARR